MLTRLLPVFPYRTLRERFEDRALAVILFVTAVLLGAFIVFVPGLAHAQGAGAVPDPTFADVCAQMLQAIQSGNGWVIAGFLVFVATWALRKGVLARLPWPWAVTWLHDHPAVAYLTPFALSALGGVCSTLAAHQPWTAQGLIMGILKVGVTAVASFVGAKTITESHDLATAAAAEIPAAPNPAAAAVAELKTPSA